MKYSKIAFVSLLATASVTNAQATELTVQGKITPPACNVRMNGDAVLDWGEINHRTLKATAFTALDPKTATLQVNCPDGLKTSFAFRAVDAGAPGTAIPGNQLNGGDNGANAGRIFGIGLDPVTNKKIGNFTMIASSSSYDGTQNNELFGYGAPNLTAFAPAAFGSNFGYAPTQDWTILDKRNQPAAASDFSFSFNVYPQINWSTEITNTMEVPFKGAAQFYVRYF